MKSMKERSQASIAALGVVIVAMLVQTFRQISQSLTLENGFLTVDYGMMNPAKYYLLTAFIAFFAILAVLNRSAKTREIDNAVFSQR